LRFDEYFYLNNPPPPTLDNRCHLMRNLSAPDQLTPIFAHENSLFQEKKQGDGIDIKICGIMGIYHDRLPGGPLLLDVFLDPFLESINETNTTYANKFSIVMYLGTQVDDFYDNPTTFHETMNALLSKAQNTPFAVKVFRSPFNSGFIDIVYKYNLLIRKAYNDGCQYFYQLSDDTKLLTPWVTPYVEFLERSVGGLGLAGAGEIDENGVARTFIQLEFVSRVHLDIFGVLWDEGFKGWWADNWLFALYGEKYRMMQGLIQDTHVDGRKAVVVANRYVACHHVNYVNIALPKAKRRITEWLVQQPPTHSVQLALDYYSKMDYVPYVA